MKRAQDNLLQVRTEILFLQGVKGQQSVEKIPGEGKGVKTTPAGKEQGFTVSIECNTRDRQATDSPPIQSLV